MYGAGLKLRERYIVANSNLNTILEACLRWDGGGYLKDKDLTAMRAIKRGGVADGTGDLYRDVTYNHSRKGPQFGRLYPNIPGNLQGEYHFPPYPHPPQTQRAHRNEEGAA